MISMKRAVWTNVNGRLHSKADVAEHIEWCVKSHVSLILAGVNHCTGAMVYASDVAPQLETSAEGTSYRTWDPMAELLARAKDAGVEVHAWVCMANAGPATLGQEGGLTVRADGPRPLTETHRDWFLTDHRGQTCIELCRSDSKRFLYVYLNMAREEVREYLARICLEIADRYPVNGIHMDYIRFPFTPPGLSAEKVGAMNAWIGGSDDVRKLLGNGSARYGFDESTLAAFERETGVWFSGMGAELEKRVTALYLAPELKEKWYAWKASKVTELVRMLKGELSRRGRKLSAAVFSGYPWCGGEVAQRWPEWVREGWVDMAIPMDYDLEPGAYEERLFVQNASIGNGGKTSAAMLSGINAAVVMGNRGADEAAERARWYEETAGKLGRQGICVFNYNAFRSLVW